MSHSSRRKKSGLVKADPQLIDEIRMKSSKQFDPESLWMDSTVLPVQAMGEKLSLVRTDTVNFSEEFAAQLLTYEEFAPDRPLSNTHVNRLLQAMQNGTFRWEQVQIIICSCLK